MQEVESLIRKRQQEHARSGKLNPETQYVQYSFSKKDASKDDLLQTEKDHIADISQRGIQLAGEMADVERTFKMAGSDPMSLT